MSEAGRGDGFSVLGEEFDKSADGVGGEGSW